MRVWANLQVFCPKFKTLKKYQYKVVLGSNGRQYEYGFLGTGRIFCKKLARKNLKLRLDDNLPFDPIKTLSLYSDSNYFILV